MLFSVSLDLYFIHNILELTDMSEDSELEEMKSYLHVSGFRTLAFRPKASAEL